MSQGSTRIKVTPSQASLLGRQQQLAPELQAAVATTREGEFAYNYIYGFRKLSDPLIDFRRESKQWTYPQDVEMAVFCRAENGQYLTFADIKIDQSSTEHEAQILSGGIGQDHIRILLKIKNTYWFKYEVRMYGRNNLQDIN